MNAFIKRYLTQRRGGAERRRGRSAPKAPPSFLTNTFSRDGKSVWNLKNSAPPRLCVKLKEARGLSLIEVMLALTILGLAIVVLLAAAAKGVAIAGKAKEYETARTLMAQLQLEEPLQLDDLDEDSERGSFDGDHRKWEWQRDIVQIGAEEDEIYQITTTIRWPVRKRMAQEQVITYLHLPTALQGGFIDDNARGARL